MSSYMYIIARMGLFMPFDMGEVVQDVEHAALTRDAENSNRGIGSRKEKVSLQSQYLCRICVYHAAVGESNDSFSNVLAGNLIKC